MFVFLEEHAGLGLYIASSPKHSQQVEIILLLI